MSGLLDALPYLLVEESAASEKLDNLADCDGVTDGSLRK
jgi:hypothetical protein